VEEIQVMPLLRITPRTGLAIQALKKLLLSFQISWLEGGFGKELLAVR